VLFYQVEGISGFGIEGSLAPSRTSPRQSGHTLLIYQQRRARGENDVPEFSHQKRKKNDYEYGL